MVFYINQIAATGEFNPNVRFFRLCISFCTVWCKWCKVLHCWAKGGCPFLSLQITGNSFFLYYEESRSPPKWGVPEHYHECFPHSQVPFQRRTIFTKSMFPLSFSHLSSQCTASTEYTKKTWSPPISISWITLHSTEAWHSLSNGALTFVPSFHSRPGMIEQNRVFHTAFLY